MNLTSTIQWHIAKFSVPSTSRDVLVALPDNRIAIGRYLRGRLNGEAWIADQKDDLGYCRKQVQVVYWTDFPSSPSSTDS